MADATDTQTAGTKMDQAIAEVTARAEAPVAAAADAAPVEAAPVAVKAKPAKAAPAAKTAARAPKAPAAAAKPATATKAKAAPKKAAAKKAAPKKPAKITSVKPAAPRAAKPSTVSQIKDTIMAKTQNTAEEFTAKVKDAVSDAQDRAKVAFEKSTALLGEAGEFTKGNVEAVVESGKILAAGLQGMGKDYVAETKSAFETMTADVKELAAVKSPADFFKLQGEILRRNFDAVVAAGSKHSEAMVKLTNESFAPISNRVSIAIEKVKKAA